MKDTRTKADLLAALDALAAEAWSGVAYIDPINSDTGKPFATPAEAASAAGYQTLAHALDPEGFRLTDDLLVDGPVEFGPEIQKQHRGPTRVRVVSNAPGRRRLAYACPACGRDCEAFAWSMAGSGKRCPHCNEVAHLSDGRAAVVESEAS